MVWMAQTWSTWMGTSIASIIFLYAMFQQYFPYHLQKHVEKYARRLFDFVNPYIQIKIHEYTGERFEKSEAYIAIQTYLSTNSSKQGKRLKADIGKNSKNLALSMDDNEEVRDEYQNAQFWWASHTAISKKQTISIYPTVGEGHRYYKLSFHKKHRGLVTDSYMNHVLEVGKAKRVNDRVRKLYTNNPSTNWYGYMKSVWSHVTFNHPSTFHTLAMDAEKKKDITDDLTTFSEGQDYYKKIGKAWKRGYLLYGPPGTGKSTMIAAIANYLDYDIYDLELTTVKNNTELRKLLIETSNKSVIVIEDIDCSLDLTGQRKKKTTEEKETKDPLSKKNKENSSNEDSKVTLSGLLNFIDGLWSACGEERIIIFTTNYKEKLDPALVRRGRMDKHIEMSYCTFGAFKVLAKNYLDLDTHHLFETIEQMLAETQITPADVAENLMPKTKNGNFTEICLENLVQALKNVQEEAKLRAVEEAKENNVDEPPAENVAKNSTGEKENSSKNASE